MDGLHGYIFNWDDFFYYSFEAKATRGLYWKGVKADNYIIIVLLRII